MLGRRISGPCAVALLLAVFPSAHAQPQREPGGRPVQIRTIQGNNVPVGRIDGIAEPLMEACGVRDLSLAVINDGAVVYTAGYGARRARTEGVASRPRVFRAASLSKPVFAYLVMRLVDKSLIALDAPLFRYLPKPLFTYEEYGELRGDRRYQAVTARLVLSHQTGFPNWRWQSAGGRLDIEFLPGERFTYSGEGYEYLQFVIEKKLGKGLEQLARDEVFVPLGMTETSFRLEERFDGRVAADLEHAPEFLKRKMRDEASAAGSLLTTAADYGRFVTAVLKGEGLSGGSAGEMLRPQVRITSRALFGPEAGERADRLAWCLGWGRFTTGPGDAIFHMGSEEGCENYAVVFLKEGVGLVVLSSGEGREPIAPRLAARLIGDGYSPFDWMDW